jgi:hypothetical protein
MDQTPPKVPPVRFSGSLALITDPILCAIFRTSKPL